MDSPKFLIFATQEGIYRTEVNHAETGPTGQVLGGTSLEAVTQDAAGNLYAGSDRGHIYRSCDGGRSWSEVFKGFPASRGLWTLAAHPIRPGQIYAGLEPASLWVSRDKGDHWDELIALRDHSAGVNWYFYEPALPHVRAISFDPRGERLCIGIEVGGVLISPDEGASFEDKSQGVDEDVHTISVSPGNRDHLFAMTGGGLYRSRNAGIHWKKLEQGLDRWYCVPLAFVSPDGRRICLGAGNEPPPWESGADAAIYWSEDEGDGWHLAEGPFPLRGMVTSMVAVPGELNLVFAGTSDGMLLRSGDGGKRWTASGQKFPRIEEMLIYT